MKDGVTPAGKTRYILICSAAYCLPVAILFALGRFSGLFWLYIGNMIFLFLMMFFVAISNWQTGAATDVLGMISSGMKMALKSIVLSCLICATLVFVFREKWLAQTPANTSGFVNMLFLNAIVVNLFAAAFGVLMGAMAAGRNKRNSRGREIT